MSMQLAAPRKKFGKYRGKDEIGKLMHDFSCTDPDDMDYEALAKKARYCKQDEEGVAVYRRWC